MDHRLLENLALRLRSKGIDVPRGELEAALDEVISKLRASVGGSSFGECRQLMAELVRIYDSERIDRN
jgi:hypothetical protein